MTNTTKTSARASGRLVCFRSAFRCDGSRGGEESPNITHAVLDGADRTACGRHGWETDEGPLYDPHDDSGDEPPFLGCLRCCAAVRRHERRLR